MTKIIKSTVQINKEFWHPTEEHKQKFYALMDEMTEVKPESVFNFRGYNKTIPEHKYYIDSLNGREKAMSQYGAVSLISESTDGRVQIAIKSKELFDRFNLLENMYFKKEKNLFENSKK